MKFILVPAGLFLTVLACDMQGHETPPLPAPEYGIVNETGNTIEKRFNPPPGYTRVAAPEGSFASYLRRALLKPHGAVVHYYDGRVKPDEDIYVAVLDMDIGTKDLQQCADAVMRLRAEYLYEAHKEGAIHFKLTNGFVADYDHWRQGYRMAFRDHTVSWVKAAQPSNEYESFRKYLEVVYSYAGTLSLSRELKPVPYADMKPGDVLIMGGSPGHAVTVMDMAQNKAGQKVYLLSQSYMPAQDIQILRNLKDAGISPWYVLGPAEQQIETPQWRFSTGDLKRFAD